MIFKLEDVTVYFPYDNIYSEHYSYMLELKHALDAKDHCLLECLLLPENSALLSLLTSYTLSKLDNPVKLIYYTRTVRQMEKTLAELKLLHSCQTWHLGPAAKILAIGLSSRKNLCQFYGFWLQRIGTLDAACRKRTASWFRALTAENPEVETYEFFANYKKVASGAILPPGVYALQDLRAFGKRKGWCPYFLASHMVQFANVVVYSYQYLRDPKVAGIISKKMQESVVVFDEAHHIDNVCIEALSVSVRRQTLEVAMRNLNRINKRLKVKDTWLSIPALPSDILKEAVPGNIC